MSRTTHLILIGFMGSGKSSVSKRLSVALHLPLIETDLLVCSDMQALFAQGGEKLVREKEQLILQELIHLPPSVISTGGGMILNPLFTALNGYRIFLYADFQEITKRLAHDRSRPLSPTQALYDTRLPLYQRYADLTIDTNGQSVDTVTQSILERLPHGL